MQIGYKILLLVLLAVSACKRDYEFLRDNFHFNEMKYDMVQNREQLYYQSYVGVHIDVKKIRR